MQKNENKSDAKVWRDVIKRETVNNDTRSFSTDSSQYIIYIFLPKKILIKQPFQGIYMC